MKFGAAMVMLTLALCFTSCSLPSSNKPPFKVGGLLWYQMPDTFTHAQLRALSAARYYVSTHYPGESAYRRYGGLIVDSYDTCSCWQVQFTALRIPPFDSDAIYSSLTVFVDKRTLRVVGTGIAK
jgi:hypothetical protein